MSEPLLTTLLSQALVAFTIEFDNEFEHRMTHRTTRSASKTSGPWLASMVMWHNVMRLVPEDGVSYAELERHAHTKLSLSGMQRWGYVTVEADPADVRAHPPERDWVVRPTSKGRRAQEVWQRLDALIEQRWRTRFGEQDVDALREALAAIVVSLDVAFPAYLPVAGYGLGCEAARPQPLCNSARGERAAHDAPLATLLSQVLLALALEIEEGSALSVAVAVNILRVLDEHGVRVRDLPNRTGVSKESIAMASGLLTKRGYAEVQSDPGHGRQRVMRLTPKGTAVKATLNERIAGVEKGWRRRFDATSVDRLRTALERFVGGGTRTTSPLFEGLTPYPDGWRATVRAPETLPHFPMVLHRGGFPDGA
jgi:DNA-binding MarR family transcriptional regulator